MVDFNEKLKSLRKQRNLTQQQVAERVGVTKAMISAYETSMRCPSYDVLIKLSAVYNITTDYLFGLSNNNFIQVDGLTDEEISAINTIISLLKSKH